MKYLLLLIAIIVGTLIPIQGTINSRLGLATGQPLLATAISFAGGLIAISLVVVAVSGGIPKWEPTAPTPFYLVLGGLPGVAFVLTTLILIPHIGVAAALSGLIVGQLASSLLFDHFGWLGAPIREVSLTRLAGVSLLIVGALLVVRGDSKGSSGAVEQDGASSQS